MSHDQGRYVYETRKRISLTSYTVLSLITTNVLFSVSCHYLRFLIELRMPSSGYGSLTMLPIAVLLMPLWFLSFFALANPLMRSLDRREFLLREMLKLKRHKNETFFLSGTLLSACSWLGAVVLSLPVFKYLGVKTDISSLILMIAIPFGTVTAYPLAAIWARAGDAPPEQRERAA